MSGTPKRDLKHPCRRRGFDACIAVGAALAVAVAAMIFGGLVGPRQALAADTPSNPMPKATKALLARGNAIYFRRCSFCHGLLGDGNGPAAKYLDPRPRDFTLGTYKFRTTQSGELPVDTDLFRTVSRGLPGTGMQSFDGARLKNGLGENDRWAVIAYIKTFAREFADPDLDPIKTGKVVKLPAKRPPYSPELVAKGQKVFIKAKCWECHGKSGRGDGQKSFDRKDDWGFPIRIRNVTHPWKIKGGTEVEDIYMRFSTGISGTPMPSFVKALNEDERWQLAAFIKSFQHKLTTHQVLKAKALAGALPTDPKDKRWKQAEPMDVRLAGQVVAPPRWQNPSIEMITVQAVFNDKEIAFRITWDDPFKDVDHKKEMEFNAKKISAVGVFNSFVEANGMIPRKLKTFRDAVALQFPVKPPKSAAKPHFFRGDTSNPVHLWLWQADLDAKGKRGVIEGNARGWKQPIVAQAKDKQQIVSKAVWDQGRWTVVVKRPLTTDDTGDVQFRRGVFIPMALNAWDGSNGEHGLIMSLSTWHYVFLEAPTPLTVYLFPVLGFVLAGGLGIGLARRVTRNGRANDAKD